MWTTENRDLHLYIYIQYLNQHVATICVDMYNVHQIAEDERIDGDKPLEQQVDPDPDFWRDFRVSRPSRLVD